MKIYTRTGDDGSTGLLGPGRVPKSAPRVEAYDSVDELNAQLGTARALDGERWLQADLAGIQGRLFALGAELATAAPTLLAKLDRVTDADVERLEATIDRLDAELPTLARFVLPGGTPLAAQLHLARTVCRRAERRVVTLAAIEGVDPRVLRFLNRLADLLFVMARWSNRRAGVADVEWNAGPAGQEGAGQSREPR